MWLVAFRKRLTEATLRGGAYETLFGRAFGGIDCIYPYRLRKNRESR